tara:strand:- start:802 stop:1557 length:756 start_codon:yes stop_codon:yes gene_type:complete
MSEKYTANEWATMEGGHTLERKKKFDFLRDEITEAKLFRSPTSFKNKDPEQLAHNIYAHVLSLQAMRYTNPGVAGKYAQNTVRFGGFDGVRTGASDLHNMIAGLERMDTKGVINIPKAQLRKMLRDIQNGIKVTDRDRRTIMALERGLGIRDPNLKAMRRIVSDWPRATPQEQKLGATRLGFMMNHYARGSDLHRPYINSIKGAPNAKSPYAPLVKWGSIAAAAAAGYALVRDKEGIRQASNVAVKKYGRP